jgi:hypothetical protein
MICFGGCDPGLEPETSGAPSCCLTSQPLRPYLYAMSECGACGQVLDATDRYCRRCGAPVTNLPGFRFLRPPALTPEQAGSYWRNFFRPFFTVAFVFFGAFFLVSLIMVTIWFFMFRR